MSTVTITNATLRAVYNKQSASCGLPFAGAGLPAGGPVALDPFRMGLLKYCAPFVNATETFLKNSIRDALEFKLNGGGVFNKLTARGYPVTHSILDEAFTDAKRAKILGMLAAMLHFHVYRYHQTAHPGVGVANPSAADVNTLAAADNLAGHAVRTITHNFQQSLLLACRRIRDDWENLETLFFEGQGTTYLPAIPAAQCMTLVKLADIRLSGSEVHKEGRQLLMLRFRMVPDTVVPTPGCFTVLFACCCGLNTNTISNSNTVLRNLVYKPSDLEYDTRMVGNTQVLLQRLPGLVYNGLPHAAPNPDVCLPNLATGSLLELLNARVPAPPNLLPTYRIFPRKPGSLRPDNQTADSYGYLEFLPSNPDRTSPRGDSANPLGIPNADWDWAASGLTMAADLQRFYELWGWYSAIAMIFGLADAHEGNFLVSRKLPYFIDLEASGSVAINTFGATCMTKVYIEGCEKLDAKCQIFARTVPGGSCRTTQAQATAHINPAIAQAITFFGTNYVAIDAWLGNAHLAETIVRFVPRATRIYGDMINNMMSDSLFAIPAAHPAATPLPNATYFDAVAVVADGLLAANGDAAAITRLAVNPLGLRQPFRAQLLVGLDGDYFKWNYQPNDAEARFPVFALATPANDFGSIVNCDYPSYYRRLGSQDLLNSHGVVVPVPVPPLEADLRTHWTNAAIALPALGGRAIAGPAWFDYDHDPHRPLTALGAVIPRNGIDIVRCQLKRCDPAVAVAAALLPVAGVVASIMPAGVALPGTTLVAELNAMVATATAHYNTWQNARTGGNPNDPCHVVF